MSCQSGLQCPVRGGRLEWTSPGHSSGQSSPPERMVIRSLHGDGHHVVHLPPQQLRQGGPAVSIEYQIFFDFIWKDSPFSFRLPKFWKCPEDRTVNKIFVVQISDTTTYSPGGHSSCSRKSGSQQDKLVFRHPLCVVMSSVCWAAR